MTMQSEIAEGSQLKKIIIKSNDEEDNHPVTEIPISIKEVSDQCRLLKNNKSPGSDNLTN